MPDEIMRNMHETGMAGSHHWAFWLIIIAGAAVAIFLVWWFFVRNSK